MNGQSLRHVNFPSPKTGMGVSRGVGEVNGRILSGILGKKGGKKGFPFLEQTLIVMAGVFPFLMLGSKMKVKA